MKILFNIITIVTILLSHLSFSQNKGLVKYRYVEALQMGNLKGDDYNAYMVFNKQRSYYVTAKDSLEKIEDITNQKMISDDNKTSIQMGLKVSKQGDQVINDIQKKTMWSNVFCVKQAYVKEIKPQINWKIEKETKKIGKFTCQKATAIFRGRNYTAWFTSKIPLPYGPWKLQGLPGLILEAYDAKKYVYWGFKSVEYPSKTKEKAGYMKIPNNLKVLNYSEFKAFQIKQIETCEDKLKIAKKELPDFTFYPPKISDMFIECE